MKTTLKWRQPQNEADLKNEDDIKYKDDLKNEYYLILKTLPRYFSDTWKNFVLAGGIGSKAN